MVVHVQLSQSKLCVSFGTTMGHRRRYVRLSAKGRLDLNQFMGFSGNIECPYSLPNHGLFIHVFLYCLVTPSCLYNPIQQV